MLQQGSPTYAESPTAAMFRPETRSAYKTKIPKAPTGSVYVFQGIQTCIGLALALALDYLDAETRLRRVLRFDGSVRSMGVVLAIVALVGQLVMIPALHDLIKARERHSVGQPVHHPAPGELASEDDRILFLYKLRAFENIIEWLPSFLAKATATCVLGYVGTTALLCVPYLVGKVMFSIGYGTGDSDRRVPGLIVSDFFGLMVLRGILIIEVFRHFALAS